ncbi:Trk system potassium transporter TrkA [Pseudomonas sp. GX19020]|uniref:Trk system potassium transporter TrkA n=1 Tax=Pseudomonadota TaxID=1224 RepID=UPI00089987BB|nr:MULTISPECIES: Trk system potassium transporter TrkA [Pseudomonadota]MCL4065156.1 Trk system potassium transporter TrkA [Pseudomonas sp. GX19020]SEB93042.1 trk system potassium uptake protein TrkA [Rhodobacter sp. 24-YEA-8]
MKVIICGAGQVGWQIARQLAGEKNDVTIVDTNADLIRRATEVLDVQGVVGFASHPDILEKAGARDADMVIAATYSDEVNMVTCQIAASAFNVTRRIARIRAQNYLETGYSDLYNTDRLAIDVIISPELEVAEAALQRLAAPETFDTEVFMSGRAHLLGIRLGPECPVLNTPLRQLNDLFPSLRAIVVGVRRNEKLFAPHPEDQLLEDDQIYLFVHTEDVSRSLGIFGKREHKQDSIVIIGGGNVGLTVARALEARSDRVRVRMIEKNRQIAEAAADQLSRTIVLNGDGMDMDLLAEAGVDRADAVLVVTDDDKTNLLVSVRAKQAGCPLTIALVNDPTMAPLMAALDLDAWINPRATTVSSILRHIRHGRVRAVYSLGDGEAEMIEAQVMSTSPISGKMIRDIAFPEGVLVGGVMKGDRMLKPEPDTRIEPGDVVAVFALVKDVPEVERLFQVSIDFF